MKKTAYSRILREVERLQEWEQLKEKTTLLAFLARIDEQDIAKVSAEDLETLPDTYKVLGTYVNGSYLVINPHRVYAVELPKAEDYSNYYDTLDIAPFDAVRNAPTDKEQQQNPRRKKLDRTDRDNFFERGLHETVDVPESERPLTPFGSLMSLAWDTAYVQHPGLNKLRAIIQGNLPNKKKRKIANHTYLRIENEGNMDVFVALRLHQTDVVVFRGATIELNTGGWNTVTTRDRMNMGLRLAGVDGHVYTHRGDIYYGKGNDWDVRYPFFGDTYYHDSITITWDGEPLDSEPVFVNRRNPRRIQRELEDNGQESIDFEEAPRAEKPQTAKGLESLGSEKVPKNNEGTYVIYPTPEQIIEMHDDIIERMGESTSGVTDETHQKLEAAIGRMQSGMSDFEFYPTIVEKAAILMESIVLSHAFIDANKRTAVMAGVLFLTFNGISIEDTDEFSRIIEEVATKQLLHAPFVQWLKNNSYPSDEGSSHAVTATESVPSENQEALIIYPDPEDIIDAHAYVLETFGGRPGDFQETRPKLEAAIGRMRSTAFGHELFQTIVEKTAVLIHSIVTSHPFPDGNKRTAYLAAMEFLYENDLYVTDPSRVVGAVHLMAENEGTYDMILHSLEGNVSPTRSMHHRNLKNLSWQRGFLKNTPKFPIYSMR